MGKHGNYQAAVSDVKVQNYCMKDGDFIWWGRDPTLRAEMRGKKRNLLLADLIADRTTVDDAVSQSPELILKYDQLTQNLSAFKASKRAQASQWRRPSLVYLVGPSGVGKTTLAMSLFPPEETYKVPLPSKQANQWWFNGYHGQRCLVFDNVSKETVPPYDLLCQMVDNSSSLIPVKGGLVRCSPSVIVVTSVLHPSILWEGNWDIQMKRRLSQLHEAFLLGPDGRKLSSYELQSEISNGLSYRNVQWEETKLDEFRVLTLPPATVSLLATLQASLNCVEKPPTVQTPPLIEMDAVPLFDPTDSELLENFTRFINE